jgi:hypothetical protein
MAQRNGLIAHRDGTLDGLLSHGRYGRRYPRRKAWVVDPCSAATINLPTFGENLTCSPTRKY